MEVGKLTRTGLCLALLGCTAAYAQRGTGDWMTSGFDAQRSHWVRSDNKISVSGLSKPGEFRLDWKTPMVNSPRALHNTTPPALLDFYISYRGFRTLGFFGASSNKVIALDTDLARVEWEKQWDVGATAATVPCPGGMTSAVTRPTGLAYPPLPTGGGAGRGSPAKSAVGEPYEGAVTLRRATPPPPPPPKPIAGAKPAAPAPSPFAPRVQWVLALTGDGMLHSMWVSNGTEPEAPMPFLPAGAHAVGLISVDGVVYAATTNGCGSVPDGVWALDMASRQVTKWESKGLYGGVGPAIAPDGTLFAAGSSGKLTALAPRSLAVKAHYDAGAPFVSSPVVFEFKGKDMVAIATADGRLHVVESALNFAGYRSEPVIQPNYDVRGLASWQDLTGRRWILAPTGKAVAAFELLEQSGRLALQKRWESPALVSPLTPVVVNGVVFALSSGELRTGDVARTVKGSRRAVLYALDGATGNQLWNSGDTITGFVHSGALAAGGTRVYLATYDGTQYAFGFPIERLE